MYRWNFELLDRFRVQIEHTSSIIIHVMELPFNKKKKKKYIDVSCTETSDAKLNHGIYSQYLSL